MMENDILKDVFLLILLLVHALYMAATSYKTVETPNCFSKKTKTGVIFWVILFSVHRIYSPLKPLEDSILLFLFAVNFLFMAHLLPLYLKNKENKIILQYVCQSAVCCMGISVVVSFLLFFKSTNLWYFKYYFLEFFQNIV